MLSFAKIITRSPGVDPLQVAVVDRGGDVDDGSAPEQEHQVGLVGPNQEVRISVLVHVHAAAQG